MMRLRGHEQSGAGMLLVMILVTLLFAIAAAMTMTSMAGLRATVESDSEMRAFYLADSGAQVGIAMLRASGDTAGDSTFSEHIAGGTVGVEITKLNSSLYKIRSHSSYADHERTVEVFVAFRSGLDLPGGLTVMFSRGVELTASEVATSLLGASRLSGMDHAPDGTLLSDQSKAIPGLAMNTVPGQREFDVTLGGGSGRVEGLPVPFDSAAPYIGPDLTALRDRAKDFADVEILGSKVLGSADSGLYGASGDQKLVYARLGQGESLEMRGDFQGHGTLVIESDRAEHDSVLKMGDLSTWHGLVLVYLTGAAEVQHGSLIRTKDESKIIGGLAMFLNTDGFEIKGLGKFYHGSTRASVLYSSQLISNAVGVEANRSARVIAYRLP